MRGHTQTGQVEVLDSLLAWWALAGVDASVGETPCNWLTPAVPQRPPEIATTSPGTPAHLLSPDVPERSVAAGAMPKTLELFHAWLETEPALPESHWIGPRIAPVGQVSARLMVVVDMPDADDSAAQALLTGDRGILFDAMLAALNLSRADIYLTGLAIARPPGGMIDAPDLHQLVARMRHHVALVQPQRLLVLGEKAGSALFSGSQSEATASLPHNSEGVGLQQFNHHGGTVAGIMTHHPRMLLRQPGAKAECWVALQLLIKELQS